MPMIGLPEIAPYSSGAPLAQ